MNRVFHDSRSSLCPECLRLLAADIVESEQGVILEKHCPEHGSFSTRIAAEHEWLRGLQWYCAHTQVPATRQSSVRQGCPQDCGECPAHRQKAAFFLFELTRSCDLGCPICLGAPEECGAALSLEETSRMIQAILDYAGPGQIISLGGGEPTTHPQFFDVVEQLHQAGFDALWLYTNGRRLARDPDFAAKVAAKNLYVVLQWDGFSDEVYRRTRGAELWEEKRRAFAHLKSAGAQVGLCPTIVRGVNEDQLGQLYQMLVEEPQLGTLDIAPIAFVGKGSTYSLGREQRITSQDILQCLERQSDGALRLEDFSPVSYSHPECLQIAYLLPLPEGGLIPLKRFLDPEDYRALLADKPLLALTPELGPTFLSVVQKLWVQSDTQPDKARGLAALKHVLRLLFPNTTSLSEQEFARRSKNLVKVVLVHSYMDRLNFDVGRTKMCISRTLLPDGRFMPTCAYSVVHRGITG